MTPNDNKLTSKGKRIKIMNIPCSRAERNKTTILADQTEKISTSADEMSAEKMIASNPRAEVKCCHSLQSRDRVSEHDHPDHLSKALCLNSSSRSSTLPVRIDRRVRARRSNLLSTILFYLISIQCYHLIVQICQQSSVGPPFIGQVHGQHTATFPGVSRDLASFCSARPSLSIDLASMIVHVKKSTSFNYKLYLFSADNYVFQTGQIVPRDDFRIHSFPVKLKHFKEFLPADVKTFYRGSSVTTLEQVPSTSFNVKDFFSLVQIEPSNEIARNSREANYQQQKSEQKTTESPKNSDHLIDAHGDVLPGDEMFVHHKLVGSSQPANSTIGADDVNKHIQFDRDDQLAILDQSSKLHQLNRRESSSAYREQFKLRRQVTSGNRDDTTHTASKGSFLSQQQMIMPVGAFSSFHVNTTYLVRKDFEQREPQLIRLQVDPVKFQVTQVHIITGADGNTDLGQKAGAKQSSGKFVETLETRKNSTEELNKLPKQVQQQQGDDYAFLSHKLLRDPDTRITSINQIYEDWITRNFYTIVYIQRRLDIGVSDVGGSGDRAQRHKKPSRHDQEAIESRDGSSKLEEEGDEGEESDDKQAQQVPVTIVTDRLIFRGSSMVLLGADQLEYQVKASAFITEKNGLHYYLEFLPSGKFYLGAIDWAKRPFIIMDSQRFPTRLTKTLFDNEELLLCPPSVCYSARPIDEIVSYGRVMLSDKFQFEANILTKALSHPHDEPNDDDRYSWHKLQSRVNGSGRVGASNASIDEHDEDLTYVSGRVDRGSNNHTGIRDLHARDVSKEAATAVDDQASKTGDLINLDALIEAIRQGSGQLEVRLHLRDWTWTLPRVSNAPALVGGPFKKAGLVAANKSGFATSTSNMRQRQNDNGISGEVAPELTPASRFSWHFEWARRNDIKVNPDTYGFVLSGHQIDASYRVYNELYLISANHLITINYTNPNETVTSVHPIGDEFVGLSSSLLDPITGAYYDRYANQIYFFKGDRYVGYDYATKKPLGDFLLPPAIDMLTGAGGGSFSLPIPPSSAASPPPIAAAPLPILSQNQGWQAKPLVSSLPVVGILGRQHHVDAIYHDQHDDFVYIFTGMQFYTFQASDFKDGAFRSMRQPVLQCINEHFLHGCRFDEAYPNPCKSEPEGASNAILPADKLLATKQTSSKNLSNSSSLEREEYGKNKKQNKLTMALQKEPNFSDEQQLKLRSIAARGGGRLDYLLESTLTTHGAAARAAGEAFIARGGDTQTPSSQSAHHYNERIVIYLLISMVLIMILVTVAMIFVVVNWTVRVRKRNEGKQSNELKNANPDHLESTSQGQALKERIAYPPAISQYLSNQYYNHQRQPASYYNPAGHARHYNHHHQAVGYLGGGGAPSYNQPRRAIARRSSQPPLPSPPPQQTQLFDALAQQAPLYKTTKERPSSSRFNDSDIIDSSAL